MQRKPFEGYLDLRRMDIDPDVFPAALAVRSIYTLMPHGGSLLGSLEFGTALKPQPLEAVLMSAIEMAEKTKRFEHEWKGLRCFVPRLKIAWKKGQALFQEDLIVRDKVMRQWITLPNLI